jgi:hypothetical protein
MHIRYTTKWARTLPEAITKIINGLAPNHLIAA